MEQIKNCENTILDRREQKPSPLSTPHPHSSGETFSSVVFVLEGYKLLTLLVSLYFVFYVISGKCLKGECLSFCAAENLTPCKCTEQENACKVCCVIFGRCQPHKNNLTGATLDVPNGRTCQTEEFQGTCNEVRNKTFHTFSF